MPSQKLPNYFRAYRRRDGLNQNEVAFLLGGQTGAHVCHYERFRRTPNLRTAMAFAIIFQTPIRVLCAGEYQEVEQAVRRRARRLSARLSTKSPDVRTARKLALLEGILAAPAKVCAL